MSDTSSTIRAVPFNGERSNWRKWKGKALAFAIQKGFRSSFTDTSTLIDESALFNNGTTEIEKKKFKDNREAFSFLVLSCEGPAYYCTEGCETSRAPDGDAAKAWSKLLAMYEPSDTHTSLSQLEAKFLAVEIDEEGPDAFFYNLEYYNQQMGALNKEFKRNDDKMKLHILSKLPESLNEIHTKVSGELNMYDLEKIKTIIREVYERKQLGKKMNTVMHVKGGDPKWKFKGTCYNCGIKGHLARDCRKKPKKEVTCTKCKKKGHYQTQCKSSDEKEESPSQSMFVGNVVENGKSKSDESSKWLLDSGSTVHVTTSDDCLEQVRNEESTPLEVANGVRVQVNGTGKFEKKTKGGDNLLLKDVKCAPTFVKNIVSLPKLLQEGYEIQSGNKDKISLMKGSSKLVATPGEDGLYYVDVENKTHDLTMATTTAGFQCTLEQAHKLCSHADEKTVKKVAQMKGWKLTTNTMPLCGACALAKARAKGVSKTTLIKATKPAERFFVDISGPYKKSGANSKFWMLVIDDYSGKAWSTFMQRKSDSVRHLRSFLEWTKFKGMDTKYIRADSASENKSGIEALSLEFDFIPEFTPPHTPQMNGKVERVFPTILNRAVACMIDAKLTDELQGTLWPEFVSTCTKLYNQMPRAGREKSNEELFSGKKNDEILSNLVILGTVGYVKKPGKTPKLEPKSIKCMLLGYAEHNPPDTYRYYNPETKSILVSRNTRHAEFHGGNITLDGLEDVIEQDKEQSTQTNTDDDDDGVVEDKQSTSGDKTAEVREETPKANKTMEEKKLTRVERELSRLNTLYNPTLSTNEDSNSEETKVDETHLVMAVVLNSDPGDPKQYRDIVGRDDEFQWRSSIEKELNSMAERKVFGDRIQEIPKGTRALGTRWIFKTKSDGRKKARLVAQGYTQIPGVDYSESFAPVVANSTVHVILVITLYMVKNSDSDWVCDVIDVETAFLNADLSETVIIRTPEGMQSDYPYVMLNKALYGLAQSPLAWYKTMKGILLDARIDGIVICPSGIDPCLFIAKKNGNLVGLIALYVDDCIFAGHVDFVKQLKKYVSSRFNIKDLGPIKKYLGVNYSLKRDAGDDPYFEASLKEYVDDIVKDYEKEFDCVVKSRKSPTITSAVMSTEEETVVLQSKYRSYVGRLLFAVSKCMPEIASNVRELSEKLEEPTMRDWKKVEGVIGYLK